MAKPYGDDLRRKFLLVYDGGEETLEELADRFLVSVGWAKKISATEPHRAGVSISTPRRWLRRDARPRLPNCWPIAASWRLRSEEHTSELQSLRHLVCRLLLEK